jgi:hypothetical protein
VTKARGYRACRRAISPTCDAHRLGRNARCGSRRPHRAGYRQRSDMGRPIPKLRSRQLRRALQANARVAFREHRAGQPETRPGLPGASAIAPGVHASRGPAGAGIVDKFDQFAAELSIDAAGALLGPHRRPRISAPKCCVRCRWAAPAASRRSPTPRCFCPRTRAPTLPAPSSGSARLSRHLKSRPQRDHRGRVPWWFPDRPQFAALAPC